MSLIIQAFTFAVQFGALCLVWRYTTEHNKRDFVFWVIGIMLAAQNSRFFGSVLITQMRYLFIPMMLCAIAFRWQMLRGNLGFVAKLYILLTLLIFVASAWSRYPKIFFEIKLHRTIYAILMVLMAGTMRDENDLRKILWAILPNIILLALGLQLGEREIIGVDERLSVNEANSNSVGVFSGYVLFGAVSAFVYLKRTVVIKMVIAVVALSAIVSLLGSGSRTAFASCVGASLIVIVALLTNRRRFFTTLIPLAIGILACGWKVWNTLSYSITERIRMIASGGASGREYVWEEGFHYLWQKGLWQGMGALVQGFFIQRLDFIGNDIAWGSTLNIYFDAIMETGIPGLALWLLILIGFFSCAYRFRHREKSPWRYFPIALAMFGLLQGVGESMSYRAEHPAGMFMILGLVIVSAKRFRCRLPTPPPSPYFSRTIA